MVTSSCDAVCVVLCICATIATNGIDKDHMAMGSLNVRRKASYPSGVKSKFNSFWKQIGKENNIATNKGMVMESLNRRCLDKLSSVNL